mmetsp:Transcript_21497/g.54121  ORF Transcript_21497/g.54121 Transcript_21497/m.54121 type:complete len:490 (+) Transcript_21497:166-1635(+)|eukprot:CAMPEP_0178998960 /NCGR_PEP_ID=MMETSP0795-20121207/9790_1 /TAXON_ID=88552 /ORGANISM="Amoebophrya sp., Strain Ameob2" /LENGTH=489 /DNA_ID=CAMNT_0020691671 /DNA_START=150 /DNA_END=1619 /DNA_ORIENTATION=+
MRAGSPSRGLCVQHLAPLRDLLFRVHVRILLSSALFLSCPSQTTGLFPPSGRAVGGGVFARRRRHQQRQRQRQLRRDSTPTSSQQQRGDVENNELLAESAKQILQGRFMRGPAQAESPDGFGVLSIADQVEEGEDATEVRPTMTISTRTMSTTGLAAQLVPTQDLVQFLLAKAEDIGNSGSPPPGEESEYMAARGDESIEDVADNSFVGRLVDVNKVAKTVSAGIYSALAHGIIYLETGVLYVYATIMYYLNPMTMFKPALRVIVYIAGRVHRMVEAGFFLLAVVILFICCACWGCVFTLESMTARHRPWVPHYLHPNRKGMKQVAREHVEETKDPQSPHSKRLQNIHEEHQQYYKGLEANQFPIGTLHDAVSTDERSLLVHEVEPEFRPWREGEGTTGRAGNRLGGEAGEGGAAGQKSSSTEQLHLALARNADGRDGTTSGEQGAPATGEAHRADEQKASEEEDTPRTEEALTKLAQKRMNVGIRDSL